MAKAWPNEDWSDLRQESSNQNESSCIPDCPSTDHALLLRNNAWPIISKILQTNGNYMYKDEDGAIGNGCGRTGTLEKFGDIAGGKCEVEPIVMIVI